MKGGETENITEYSIETGEFSLSAPTRVGYTFTGWSGSNLTGEDNLTVTIADGTYGDLSFVAHWQANENTLVFDANGGVGSMESQKGVTDSTLILNANAFTRKGYDFDGWSTIKDGEKQYADESVYVMGTSSTNTLYAVWTPHLNSLILNGNGNTSGSMNNMNIHSGETKALDKNTYEKQGYTFIGWAETANGNVVYTDCANYTMGVEPKVTLYAVWKANEYTISMNPQNDSSVTTQKVTYDESYTLSVPTRAGYTFDGWFTEVGGNGIRLTDADGNSIANWTVADNITVYAKWLGTECLIYTANGSEYIVSGVSDNTITEAYIPEYYNGKLVTAIGENAFSGCDKLTAVFMENTIETIGKGAFSGCSALTRLVVPFVGESRTATQEKGLLTYWFGQDSAENTEEIYQYYLNAGGFDVAVSAYVPSSLNSISLTDTDRIPFGAFAYMSMLTEVNLGNIVNIESRAFEYATGISTFNLSDTLNSVGTNAFAHTGIKNIVIPANVQTIGEGVFAGCKALTKIEIPFVGQSVNATGYNAVLGWLFGQSNYDGMVAVSQGSWTSYISAVLRMVEITNASTVSDYAFANIKTLTNVTLANSVTTIGNSAFSGCIGLTSINLECVVSFGNSAFYGTSSLTEVDFSDNLTTIGSSAFYGSRISKIELPDSIVSVGSLAFASNSVLRTIIIRKDGAMLSYSSDMLKGFNSYAKIYVPDGLLTSYKSNSDWKALGVDKFYGLSIVKSNGMAISGNMLVQYFGTDESVTIPSSITNILPYSFYRNSFVRRIVIPGTITTITDHAFYGCDNLETVKLMRGTTQILGYAFAENALLQSINLPDTLVSIGASAFDNCDSLQAILLPNNLQTIGDYAFRNTQLSTVIVHNNVTSIGLGAFQGCPLESITLPFVGGSRKISSSTATSSSTYNGYAWQNGSVYAFGYIFGGTSRVGTSSAAPSSTSDWIYQGASYYEQTYVSGTRYSYIYYYDGYYIPATLKIVKITDADGISANAFYGCTMIESLTLNGRITVVYDKAFYNCSALKSMVLPSSVTEVGSYAFYGCSNMASITLSNLAKINDYTFYNCRLLTSIILPETLTAVESYAFYNSGLESMQLPDTVISIGSYAFGGCSGITEINLPTGLKKIGDYAFENVQLTTVIIPNSVESIGNGAFKGCPLVSITLPFVGKDRNVSSTIEKTNGSGYIGSSVLFGYIFGANTIETGSSNAPTSTEKLIYQGQDAYSYYSSSDRRDRYYWTRYYIPSTLKNVTITDATGISANAFYGCTMIESLILNEGITVVYDWAFHNCKVLKAMILPASVIEVGSYAFYNCTALKDMLLPDTVTEVGIYAFGECGNLISIALSNLTMISQGLFYNCKSLTSIILPETLTAVESHAFYNSGLESMQLPDTVISIGSYAFGGCSGITEINLPTGLKKIGDYAFENVQLTTVIIPNSVESIGNGAFKGCPLVSITLPFVGKDRNVSSTVEKTNGSGYIGSSVLFGYIFGANTIETGSSNAPTSTEKLIYQGQNAYSYYSSSDRRDRYYWTRYYIPSTLKNVTITDATGISANAFYGCTLIDSLTLNEGITIIYDRAFYNCSALKSMEIPESVTNLGVYAFGGCSGLNSVILPNLTEINDNTFYNCKSLAEITLPTTLTKIGGCAFYGCSALTEIVVPNSVTLLGKYSFAQCNNLKNISLSNALTSIENYVFAECAKLSKIILPSTLTNIGSGAFSNCSELRVMEIPESVVAIGDSAFTSCSNIRVILVCNGNIMQLTTLGGSKVFDGATGKGLVVIVPKDAYQAYKTASYWNGYSSCIYSDEYIVNNNSLIVDGTLLQYWGDEKSYTVPDSVKIIGSYAFYGSAVEELKYGASLEQIKNDAFANCTKLTKINSTEHGVFNLNGSLKKIGAGAFYNNANATKVIVSKLVETIESAAFMGCNNLVLIELPFIGIDRSSAYSQSQVFGYIFGYETSNKEGTTMQHTNYYYYIPDSLREVVITEETVISKNAFINCSMIESIIIKSDLTSIGDYAFYNCGGLKTITIESNTMPTISAYVFNGDSTVVIKVNSTILSDYQSDANWSKRTLETIQ